MSVDHIATPSRTREIVSRYKLSFKKSLGQNFIIDLNILRNMIDYAQIDDTCGVIEVGPGIGSLTEQLARRAAVVVSYEIDEHLLHVLDDTLASYNNIQILHEDFLKADVNKAVHTYLQDVQTVHLVANLPYYITTPILMKVIESHPAIEQITVMLQKEVAERMVACPNTKAYGSLSIAVQYYCEPTIVMDVPKTVFIPQPNVTSSVIHLKRYEQPIVNVLDEQFYFSLIKAGFAHRRKTLRNNLKHFLKGALTSGEIEQIMNNSTLDGSRRAESLTMQEFALLSNNFTDYIESK